MGVANGEMFGKLSEIGLMKGGWIYASHPFD